MKQENKINIAELLKDCPSGMELYSPIFGEKLKEKGFPQHIAEDAYIIDNYGEDKYQIGDRLPIPLIPDYMDDVAAPTISQVLKWLREKKNIILAPNPCLFKDDYCFSWDCDVWFWGNYTHVCEDYKSYEESVLAGIAYVLDNLI